MACLAKLHNCPSATSDIKAFKDVVFPNRVPQFEEIGASLPHKLTLEDWKSQLNSCNKSLLRKLSSRNSSTSDLYQILALFFVFEGVVITALAQATALRCHNWYLVLLLFAIAFIATLGACIHKLKEIAEGEKLYLEEKALRSSLFNSIEELKLEGSKFDLRTRQPTLGPTYRGDQGSGSKSWEQQVIHFIKTWVLSYSGAVLCILIAFSGVTIAAIRLIVT